ncbi:hypothetical protein RhiirA5_496369 [Rhizophagus irregularis]|uniref:Uncharacterized protein n=1 Tax=Rhizophagus irregularis TaxID=588596 RepID=A0A2N0RKF8_9GLOM|nr:hypothetical protein RhiirA5_496369 [Rhizophagus irregularis]PKC63792.1 hypothetical protein RhiirA1_537527 [Rhizophagus irregularis]
MSHSVNLVPIEDTVGALADLVEGKENINLLMILNLMMLEERFRVFKEDNIVAIPGKHLEENFDAIKVNLNSDELTEIRKFINSVKIIGDRYSSDILDMVGLNKYEVTITVNLRVGSRFIKRIAEDTK